MSETERCSFKMGVRFAAALVIIRDETGMFLCTKVVRMRYNLYKGKRKETNSQVLLMMLNN